MKSAQPCGGVLSAFAAALTGQNAPKKKGAPKLVWRVQQLHVVDLVDSAAELELVLGQLVVLLHEAEQRPGVAELVLGDAGHRREIGQLAAVQHADRVPVPQHPLAVGDGDELVASSCPP